MTRLASMLSLIAVAVGCSLRSAARRRTNFCAALRSLHLSPVTITTVPRLLLLSPSPFSLTITGRLTPHHFDKLFLPSTLYTFVDRPAAKRRLLNTSASSHSRRLLPSPSPNRFAPFWSLDLASFPRRGALPRFQSRPIRLPSPPPPTRSQWITHAIPAPGSS